MNSQFYNYNVLRMILVLSITFFQITPKNLSYPFKTSCLNIMLRIHFSYLCQNPIMGWPLYKHKESPQGMSQEDIASSRLKSFGTKLILKGS